MAPIARITGSQAKASRTHRLPAAVLGTMGRTFGTDLLLLANQDAVAVLVSEEGEPMVPAGRCL